MSWYKPLTKDNTDLGELSTWSFSGLKSYEECPYRRYMQKVKGHRDEPGPAATRGSELHDAIERYIKGEADSHPVKKEIPCELIETSRNLYRHGTIRAEENWYIDMEWNETTRENMWGVFIVDLYTEESDTSAHIIDWKSGKSFGNEMKHSEQLMFYATAAFARYPKLQYVSVGACYIDEGKIKLERGFSRKQIEILKPSIHARAIIMTTAKKFEPKPSKQNCRFCNLKLSKDGEKPLCEWGVL